MSRTMALLCNLGDVTIGWEPANDAAMLPIIQQMIDNKIRFHVTRKRKNFPVEKPSTAMDQRKITIPDESLQRLNAAGLLMVGALIMGDTTGEVATTAEQVIENDTVAVQAAQGG